MIEQTIQFIRDQLAADPDLDLNSSEIIADNLHVLSDVNRIGLFLSLLNIEEEATMKNKPNYIRRNDQLRKIEPPILLNLYILFAFRMESYSSSITKLSQLVSYFQSNPWFPFSTIEESQSFQPPIDRLIFELYNVNFEQLNHIWSVLGGHHYPSVLYKVRVVKVQRNRQEDGAEISSIILDSKVQQP